MELDRIPRAKFLAEAIWFAKRCLNDWLITCALCRFCDIFASWLFYKNIGHNNRNIPRLASRKLPPYIGLIYTAYKEHVLKILRAAPLCRYLKICLGLFTVTFGLSACADHMPVPGGTDDVNKSCFKSIADMQARILSIRIGEPEGEVLASLCAKRESLTRLDRREIRTALLGGPDVLFASANGETDSQIIQSLYGYSLNYKGVKSVHGFTSPIRIRTDQTGFNYTVTLVFRDGKLYARPILTGGIVNDISSGTIFDFITPGTVLSHTPVP